jgi:hypothetical protein
MSEAEEKMKQVNCATAKEREGLLQIRRKRNLVGAIFFLYIPAGLLFWLITGSEYAMYVFGVIWMVAFFVAGMRVTFSRCPRCGEFFHVRMFYGSVWTRQCLHCKLSLAQGD